MKWSRSGLETAPCAETQADPQERGPPRQPPRAWRLLLHLAADLLGLEGREGEAAEVDGVGVGVGGVRGEAG